MTKESPDDAIARVQAMFGTSTEAKSVKPKQKNDDSDAEVVELLTRLCYFYPQYTLETADLLTDSQVTALLLQAEKQRAIELYNHTLIAVAPHSKKGKMVEKLIKQYRKIIEL